MNLDFSPLQRAMTSADVQAYRAQFPKKKVLRSIVIMTAIFSTIGVLAVFFLLFTLLVNESEVAAGILATFLVVFGGGYALARFVRRRKLIRLLSFANANNLQLKVDQMNPPYSGLIFSLGNERVIKEAYVFPDGREIGTYSFTTGSGRSRKTHSWNYMRIGLVRKLPHMVLDAKKNNYFGSSNLPASLQRSQSMRLGGDFDKHFTVYAPAGYERDALYVFTPDVMEALIDQSAHYDIEVVDNNLFFYSQELILMDKVESLKEALRVLSTVSDEIIDQGDYYADERIGNRQLDQIAPQGRRLKPGLSIASMAVLLLILFNIIWNMTSSLRP